VLISTYNTWNGTSNFGNLFREPGSLFTVVATYGQTFTVPAGNPKLASFSIWMPDETLFDLSRRPAPDVTGAIQHAMVALECVALDVTGDPKSTLGDLLKKHRGTLPPPLDTALSKLWGFASDQGRHLRENQAPDIKEGELIVGLAGSLVSYLFGKEIHASNTLIRSP
jgi:hypothetical protein